ncbi:MAG TPA: hypothetical protein VHS06_05570 [Chloroflexota bacterium]|nr:hypothetical protein [Chloroflexota bacterium]
MNTAPDTIAAETEGADRPVALIALLAIREWLGDRLGVIAMEVDERSNPREMTTGPTFFLSADRPLSRCCPDSC